MKTALLAALPIEIVNFWIVKYPGSSGGLSTSSSNAELALEWDLLHLPGIMATNYISFLRTNPSLCSVIFWITGYIDTAILLAAILWIARLALRRLRKLSST
jgi:hypothetical protein